MAPNAIGKTDGLGSHCDSVTIGGTEYWNGSLYQDGGNSYLTQSSLPYAGNGTGGNSVSDTTFIGTFGVPRGTELTVIATPAEHHRLASWTPSHPLNAYDTLHVTVYRPVTFTANFVLVKHTITAVVASGQDAMGTVSGTTTVDYGSDITMRATPNPNYHFLNWTEADTLFSSDDSITVQAIGDRTFTAHFAPDPTLTLNCDPTKGSVAVDAVREISVRGIWANNSSPVNISDLPGFVPVTESEARAWRDYPRAAGYVYVIYDTVRINRDNFKALVYINGTLISTGSTSLSYRDIHQLYANNGRFFFTTGRVTADANTSGLYHATTGTTVRLSATATPCYHLASWTNAAGTEVSTDATLSISTHADTTLTANFAPNIYSGDNDATAIDHFEWYGTVYRSSGDYSRALHTAQGCDSTATLHLTVVPYDTLTLGKTGEGTVTLARVVNLANTTSLYTAKDVNLANLTTDYIAQNGDILTGTLGASVKISVADGATVTLDDVTINGDNSSDWAGITCLGDATLFLRGVNSVSGFSGLNPGIQVAKRLGDGEEYTLTIYGSGSLNVIGLSAAGIGGSNIKSCGNISIFGGIITATGGSGAAGIGAGSNVDCGAISIFGGTVTATGGSGAAGIGSASNSNCGNISIFGGTITATGGGKAPGIGAGNSFSSCGNISITGGTVTANGGEYYTDGTVGIGAGPFSSSCGNIIISNGVTQLTSNKVGNAIHAIGTSDISGTCGMVTIGGTIYWDGSAYQNGGNTYLTQSPLIYTGNGTGGNSGNGSNTPASTLFINADGSYSVLRGAEVTIVATPAEHHHLASWTPSHTLNDYDTLHFTIDHSMSLTANFEPDQYSITAQVANGQSAMGTVSGSATVDYGSAVTLMANPNPCHHFVNWTDAAGTEVSTNPTFSFTATQDRILTAHFAPDILPGDTNVLALDHFEWRGTVYRADGIYSHTAPNAQGCEGTMTLHLRVMPVDTLTLVAAPPQGGLVFPDHDVFTDTVMLDTITESGYRPRPGTVLTGTTPSTMLALSLGFGAYKFSGVHIHISIPNSFFWNGTRVYLEEGTDNVIEGEYGGFSCSWGDNIIRGNGNLVVTGSVTVSDSARFIIEGGNVSITGEGNNPAIWLWSDAAEFVVNGGNITVMGGASGGCGIAGHKSVTDTKIVINGGTVTAIGRGNADGMGTSCSSVTIAPTVTSVTAIAGATGRSGIVNSPSTTVTVGGQTGPFTDSLFHFVGDSTGELRCIPPEDLGGGRYAVVRGNGVVALASPDPHYRFASWSDGAPLNHETADTFNVSGNQTLTATFEYRPEITLASNIVLER